MQLLLPPCHPDQGPLWEQLCSPALGGMGAYTCLWEVMWKGRLSNPQAWYRAVGPGWLSVAVWHPHPVLPGSSPLPQAT